MIDEAQVNIKITLFYIIYSYVNFKKGFELINNFIILIIAFQSFFNLFEKKALERLKLSNLWLFIIQIQEFVQKTSLINSFQ